MAKPREGYHDVFAQIPEPLWQALSEDAERNERSATGQLIWLLRQQYPDAIQKDAPPVETPAKRSKKGKGK
jgi:hypothetical protein